MASLILALETTTPHASVALLEDATVRQSLRAQVSTHSESLLSMVDQVLAHAGLGLSELSAIACSGGPGSFTGLRIGLATAKGLCLGANLPLLLISSLAALASRGRNLASPIPNAVTIACLDAWKGEVYTGRYQGQPPQALGPERVLPPSLLAPELAELARAQPVVLIGDAMTRWPELLVPGLAHIDHGPPDAIDVGLLASQRFQRGERDPLDQASPSYIRPSEAELMAERKAAQTPPKP